jgi:prolipoprotein diacylglyceryltransferase
VFLVWVVVYGVFRYIIEVYRGDEDRAFVGWFSTSQLISILTMVAAAGIYLLLYRRHRRSEAPVNATPPAATTAKRSARRR